MQYLKPEVVNKTSRNCDNQDCKYYKQMEITTSSHNCAECNYDLCRDCFIKQSKMTIDEYTNFYVNENSLRKTKRKKSSNK